MSVNFKWPNLSARQVLENLNCHVDGHHMCVPAGWSEDVELLSAIMTNIAPLINRPIS